MFRALLFLAVAIFTCWSGSAEAVNIYVGVTSEDAVGQRLAYEIREKISRSSRHTLVNSPNDAAFKVSIVTLESDNQTIYSITLTMFNFEDREYFDYYLTSWVGKCGSRVTESCAADVVAGIDAEIEPIVRVISEALSS